MNVPRLLRRLFRKPFDGLRHFAVVEPGVLYRCGQPAPQDLDRLIREHGLRTIVSLRGERGESDRDGWEGEERAVCERLGVSFVRLSCNHKNPPTREQVETFLRLVRDPQRRPVLVHCRIGQQRTMMFVALFWVHVKGMPAADAESEMDRLGFNIRHRRHQQLLEAFRRLAATPLIAAPN